MAKLIECIHGILWQACKYCQNKSEAELLQEINLDRQNSKSIHYDYQVPTQEETELETDLAYDLEDNIDY